MVVLKRKLWRDIKANYGAYLACAGVLVIGLTLYVSMSVILISLTDSRDDYYRKYRFGDGFARIIQGPAGLAGDIEDIKGIDRVVGRIVQEVMVFNASGEKTTTVRLVSFNSPDQPVNRFRLENGRIPAGGSREILVSPAFLKGNEYQLGDYLPLVIMGREVKFRITGTAISPEYIYEISGGNTLAPDPKAFGVAFIPYSTISSLFNMQGSVNDISFTLSKGTEFRNVKKAVERQLEGYGLTLLVSRKDQLSHSMLAQEIVGLEGSASTTPVIFLVVASAILYITLRRMIEQQRGQIGVLKAFGFSDREIIIHYLGYPLIIGGLGGFAGGLAGSWFSFQLALIYQQYYNVPGLEGRYSPGYICAAALLSIVFGVIAGYQGCKTVTQLSPAEAMRPPSPLAGRSIFIEKFGILWSSLNTRVRMAVRNVFRNRQRTVIAILGVACAFSMMVTSRGMFDSTYYLIDFQYDKVELYDLKTVLRGYTDKVRAVSGAAHVDGVAKAEPLLEVPVTLNNRWHKKDTVLTGLSGDSSLYRLLSQNDEHVNLPRNGIVMSAQLAELLDIRQGDKVTVKPMAGDVKEQYVPVKRIIPQYVGLGAYMEIDSLSAMLNSSPIASSVLVRVEKDKFSEVRKELQKGAKVAAIQDKTKQKAMFEDLMESNMASQYILLFFSFVLGFAIVYNVNIISLSERERELATLMVIGMTEREIGWILLIEQGLLGSAAILLGIPLSYSMMYGIAKASATELFNMPLVVYPGTFFVAAAGTVVFLLAAHWKITGKIKKLSMLDVLKQQE